MSKCRIIICVSTLSAREYRKPPVGKLHAYNIYICFYTIFTGSVLNLIPLIYRYMHTRVTSFFSKLFKSRIVVFIIISGHVANKGPTDLPPKVYRVYTCTWVSASMCAHILANVIAARRTERFSIYTNK